MSRKRKTHYDIINPDLVIGEPAARCGADRRAMTELKYTRNKKKVSCISCRHFLGIGRIITLPYQLKFQQL